jgi:hypothetical protein
MVIDTGKDPVTGKRWQHWHTIRGTKRDAERALNEMLAALEKGTYVRPNAVMLGDWLNQWLGSYVAMHTTLRTQESYRYIIVRHLIPNLGAIPLKQLQPEHIQNYYARALTCGRVDQEGGLSARSVSTITGFCRKHSATPSEWGWWHAM